MVNLIDIFEGEVAKSGSSTCVILEDKSLYSYQDVNDVANTIAKELACAIDCALVKEIDSETPLVAVMMNRGIGLVSAILGILKAGAAYVPVDPSFPPDRQTHIFAHSNCKILISDEESLQLALSLGVIVPPTLVINSSILSLDGKIMRDALISRSLWLPSFSHLNKDEILFKARELVRHREGGGLAYVLYTSGSTGKPKGVMLKQAGVVNIVNWFADELKLSCSSRVLGLTTFCFDISVLEMFLPLFRGAALVMVNQSSQKDPFQLLDVIKDCKVTVVQATPTTFEMLFATGWTGDKSIDYLVGGEAFRSSILPLARNCRSLRNVYGPTETTIWSSSFTLPADTAMLQFNNGVPVIPIGMPISETIFYIVSEDENAPKKMLTGSAEGELWIGGIGVAKGYLNAPDLTREKFFANPFGPGSVYRTGDVVTRLEGGMGDYVFLRRMDDQVKIDGFRIELAEIETVFSSHEMVDKAVAVVREGKLVLYIKAAGGCPLSRSHLGAIYTHSARSLTHYMMPKSIVQVTSFPETANGKLDRKALPDPTSSDLCDSIAEHDTGPGLEMGMMMGVGDNEGSPTLCHTERHPLSMSPDARSATNGGFGSGSGFGLGSGLVPPDSIPRCSPLHQKQPLQEQSRRHVTNQRGVLAMSRHICDTIEKLRGRRPTFGSSFASIGVDSLGAVMFVKYLSDSLGGIRIEPAKIYAPGVTIRSFAESLLVRLEKEKPEALLNLGIVGVPLGGSIQDIESGTRTVIGDRTVLLESFTGGDCGMSGGRDLKGYLSEGGERDGEGEGAGDEEVCLFRGAAEVQKLENSFEDILTTNRAVIEGIRGVFTFLVLYDHFHNPHNAISATFTADTYLFIMISGFTTALQLRESPQFVRTEASSASEEHHNPILDSLDTNSTINESPMKIRGRKESLAPEDDCSLFIPASPKIGGGGWFSVMVKGERQSDGLKLLPRTSFRVLPFILSRCVGLLPILWVALLLNIPPWMNDKTNNDKSSLAVKATCSALYVVGMQSWWRPACRFYGPNNLLYASILLNCFILYSIGRVLLLAVQNHLMNWASKELSPISLKPPRRIVRCRTWKQWVGDKAVILSFNRTDMTAMLVMLVVWTGVVLGLFTFMLFNTYAKNALSFIAYFAVGAIAAAALENIHYAFWDWGRVQKDCDSLSQGGKVLSFLCRVYNHCESKQSWPWVHQSKWLAYFYVSARPSEAANIGQNSPLKAAYSPLRASAERAGNSLDASLSGTHPSDPLCEEMDEIPAPVDETPFFLCCYYLWRFLPDLTAIGIGFLMSTLGDLDKESVKFVLWFVVVPYAYLVLILVSMLQKGSARYNFSRFFLESHPLTTLGYTSYAMYLFQRIMFTCYLPYVYFGIKTGNFDINVGDPNKWFENLPNSSKFAAVVSLTLLCLLVHKYFQDRFVTYWYAYIVSKL